VVRWLAIVAFLLAVPGSGAALAAAVVVDVAAGESGTCAVLESGRVRCWGAEPGEESRDAAAPAFEISGITDARRIARSGKFTCVLRANGRVSCWIHDRSPARPQDLSERKVVELGMAGEYLCMRKAGGQVSCWQIGPHARRDVTLSGATQLAVADEGQGCALRRDGTVVCWGSWAFDWLKAVERPRPVPGVRGAVEIAASGGTACARLRGGGVRCWSGSEEVYRPAGLSGALSLLVVHGVPCIRRTSGAPLCQWETPGEEDEPPPARTDARLENLGRVSSVAFHTCGVRADGKVACWGDNDRGQLGYPTPVFSRVPIEVKDLDDASALEAGEHHTCALHRGGRVSCWGRGFHPTDPFQTRPQPVTSPPVASLTPGGLGGITAEGALVSFAYPLTARRGGPVAEVTRGWERLRDGRILSFEREPLVRELRSVAGVVQMSSGSMGLCLVFGDGRLGCHGYEFSSVPPMTCSSPPNMHPHCRRAPPPPTAAVIATEVRQVSVGSSQVCATLRSGRVACGSKSPTTDLPGQSRLRPVPGIERARLVEVSDGSQVCAVQEDGQVLCWGPVWLSVHEDAPARLERLPGITDAIDVSLGVRHACVLRRNGRVACWGDNQQGQLGNGTSGTAVTAGPVQVLD
jgi:hypothetical protein